MTITGIRTTISQWNERDTLPIDSKIRKTNIRIINHGNLQHNQIILRRSRRHHHQWCIITVRISIPLSVTSLCRSSFSRTDAISILSSSFNVSLLMWYFSVSVHNHCFSVILIASVRLTPDTLSWSLWSLYLFILGISLFDGPMNKFEGVGFYHFLSISHLTNGADERDIEGKVC